MSYAAPSERPESADSSSSSGNSQTLMRGLDVIDAVGHEVMALTDLAQKLGLSKSTTHRLATALAERGYLAFTPRSGYRLGPKLLELGFLAQAQADLLQLARPHIEVLAARTEDTVHLAILEGDHALYLDKVAGRRRINISSRVGERQPLSSTGLGKALMLDHKQEFWLARFTDDQAAGAPAADQSCWLARMEGYAAAGCAYDLEENEDQIRCVAAPVRDAGHAIVGAISVSSAAQYMNDERMSALSDTVIETAQAISRELGWVRPG